MKNEIASTLSKISEVRLVKGIGVRTIGREENEGSREVDCGDQPYYYSIEVVINSSITR